MVVNVFFGIIYLVVGQIPTVTNFHGAVIFYFIIICLKKSFFLNILLSMRV